MARSRSPLRTAAKRSIARATGIPTTRSGRKRKALNALTGGNYRKMKETQTMLRKMTGTSRSRKAWSVGCLIPILCMAAPVILLLGAAFL